MKDFNKKSPTAGYRFSPAATALANGNIPKQNKNNKKGIHKFDLISKLGDGTYGSVHLARTKDSYELVAIKK